MLRGPIAPNGAALSALGSFPKADVLERLLPPSIRAAGDVLYFHIAKAFGRPMADAECCRFGAGRLRLPTVLRGGNFHVASRSRTEQDAKEPPSGHLAKNVCRTFRLAIAFSNWYPAVTPASN
jgi:hypothetical protein